MKKAKFWLAQIALVAMVSLVFGSPVFAGPDDNEKNGVGNGKGQGATQRAEKAGDTPGNAFFKNVEPTVEEDPEPTCGAWFNGDCIG